MSTGRIVGIAAVVILVLMVFVGVCMVRSGDNSPAEKTTVQGYSVDDRLTGLEQVARDIETQIADLKQGMELTQRLTDEMENKLDTLEALLAAYSPSD